MKVREFLDKLETAYREPNYYLSGGWGIWNGSKWGFDCICIIKGILWGWNNNKSLPRGGGAIYGSNGVPDTTEDGLINSCRNVSSNFNNITPGELMYMPGHCGIYIGNRTVIEATKGWGTDRVIKTQVDSYGNRSYNGQVNGGKWTFHGFLPWVDYDTESEPVNEYFVPNGEYRLDIAKCIRISPCLGNNIIQAPNVDAYTKTLLVSPYGNAMLKIGTVIQPLKIAQENGRTWGSYGNCWVCLENEDGERQATKVNETTEEYFVEGKTYKLLYDKCIRKTPELGNNILQAQNVDSFTKTLLASPYGNAMIRAGIEITCLKLTKENGRIWGSYGNCWVCLCNDDGTKQAEKID